MDCVRNVWAGESYSLAEALNRDVRVWGRNWSGIVRNFDAVGLRAFWCRGQTGDVDDPIEAARRRAEQRERDACTIMDQIIAKVPARGFKRNATSMDTMYGVEELLEVLNSFAHGSSTDRKPIVNGLEKLGIDCLGPDWKLSAQVEAFVECLGSNERIRAGMFGVQRKFVEDRSLELEAFNVLTALKEVLQKAEEDSQRRPNAALVADAQFLFDALDPGAVDSVRVQVAQGLKRLGVDPPFSEFEAFVDALNQDWGSTREEMSAALEAFTRVRTPEPVSEEEEEVFDYEAADLAWREGPGLRHGVGIYLRIHVSAKRAGRAYALRWAKFRKGVLQEREDAKKAGYAKTASPDSDDDGEKKEEPKLPEPDVDDGLLHSFQIELQREIARYKAAEKRPNGLEKEGWSKETQDINIGVLAVDAAMRSAAKTATGEDDLFGAPPEPQ